MIVHDHMTDEVWMEAVETVEVIYVFFVWCPHVKWGANVKCFLLPDKIAELRSKSEWWGDSGHFYIEI